MEVDPEGLPIKIEAMLEIVDNVMRPDLDLDGDGIPESRSIALVLEAVPVPPHPDFQCAGLLPPDLEMFTAVTLQISEQAVPGQVLDVDQLCF